MKALVYKQPNCIELQDYPDPHLVDGDVIIKIETVGICGSDLHAYHGHDPRRKPGLVMGHELAGTVAKSASARFTVGQRVTAFPLIVCGTCDYCVEGRANLCSNRTMVGMTRPGAYAEYMSIPASSVITIPQDMPFATAALTEPGATVLHAMNLSLKSMHRPLPEQRTLVIGAGAIGLMTALLLRSYGCRHICVAETNPLRREAIKKYVGCEVINPLETAPPESNYHFVVDAVGSKHTRNAALHALRPGGVFMHIGLQDWGSELDMRKLTLSEITLLGTYTYTIADMQATIHALNEGVFGDLGWMEVRPFVDGAQAFTDLDAGNTGAAKLVLSVN
jgi:2-desacetyl-2-hydroxyethyl bacteriochlorophyllide A dehydrogenase